MDVQAERGRGKEGAHAQLTTSLGMVLAPEVEEPIIEYGEDHTQRLDHEHVEDDGHEQGKEEGALGKRRVIVGRVRIQGQCSCRCSKRRRESSREKEKAARREEEKERGENSSMDAPVVQFPSGKQNR